MKKILILAFIFVLSLSIRLAYLADNPRPIESDEISYDEQALRLIKTGRYINPDGSPTSYRPPLYPAFLALIYLIFGHSHFAVQTAQIILSSFTACLLYLIAYKIFNELTAIITGISTSFYMTFVSCAPLLYTETLFTFLLAWLVFLVISMDKAGIMRFCMIGFLCGFLTLVRPSGLFMPFLIALLFLASQKSAYRMPEKRILVALTALLLCFTSVLLPWSIRNYMVHKKFVLISTNAGLNLYQGVSYSSGKIFDLGPEGKDAWGQVRLIPNEVDKSNFFAGKAVEIYKTHPVQVLKMLLIRFLFFWNVIDWDILGGAKLNYHYIFILPFAFLGTAFALKTRKDILFILAVILYVMAPVLLFPAMPRYRMPIDGYIILLGAYGIYEIFKRQKNKIYPLAWTGAYFSLSYLLYIYSSKTKYLISAFLGKIGLWH